MPSLKQLLADLQARHTQEILDALDGASIQDFQEVVAGLRKERRGSKSPRGSSRSSKPKATGHALEMNAASLVGHLKEYGRLRSEDLRKALGLSREDMSGALALASEWKMLTKTGEKRATVYKAVMERGPKAQLTLGERMRAAPFMSRPARASRSS